MVREQDTNNCELTGGERIRCICGWNYDEEDGDNNYAVNKL